MLEVQACESSDLRYESMNCRSHSSTVTSCKMQFMLRALSAPSIASRRDTIY